MELAKSIRWMCRICGTNIKSASSSVRIFDVDQLPERLQKYLCITIKPDDLLPKRICTNCNKRMDSIHGFAVLAKRTENYFSDYVKITNRKNVDQLHMPERYQSEFTNFTISNQESDRTVIPMPTRENAAGEVILNLPLNTQMAKTIQSGIGIRDPSQLMINQGIQNPTALRPHPEQSKLQGNPSLLKAATPGRSKVNLEQKRHNLKMVLATNNAQSASKMPSPTNYMVPQNQQQSQPLPPLPPSLQSAEAQAKLRRIAPKYVYPPASTVRTRNDSPSTVTSPPPPNKKDSVIYDCLNLGCVIKDMDLLKLILKALKWPYSPQTMQSQIQRLKNTRFRDVMLNPNLLQDTDLSQILSTYISPMLMQSQNPSPSSVLPTVVSYRIPADTSVHLISVPYENESPPKAPKTNKRDYVPTKVRRTQERSRTKHRAKFPMRMSSSPIEILSDDSNDNIQMFEVSIDPTLYFPQDTEPHDINSNPQRVSLLKAPAKRPNLTSPAVRRKQKRKEAHVMLQANKKSNEHQKQVQKPPEVQKTKTPVPANVPPPVASPVMPILTVQVPAKEKTPPPTNKIPVEVDKDTITIDDNTNDDELWADFKVIDSPEYTMPEEIVSSSKLTIKEEKKTDDDIPQKQIVLESVVKQETVEPEPEPQPEVPTVIAEKQISQEFVTTIHTSVENDNTTIGGSENDDLQKPTDNRKNRRKKQDLSKGIKHDEEAVAKSNSANNKSEGKEISLVKVKQEKKDAKVIPAPTRQSKRKIQFKWELPKKQTKAQLAPPGRSERKCKTSSKYYVHPTPQKTERPRTGRKRS